MLQVKTAHFHALFFTLLLAFLPTTAVSFEFRHQATGIEGLADTVVSYGLRWRTENADSQLVSVAHGGKRTNSGNFDDGTLNYGSNELTSNMVRATGELTLRWSSFGAFVRGYAFYDYENEENNRDFTPLSGEALEQVGSDAEVLDAYLSARFSVRGRPVQLRLGEQVVNWGESRFFPSGGVNVANPLNVPLFRQPTGTQSDLRRPVGMLWGVAHVASLFVVEAYYQYDWDRTILPAQGTFFSTNDGISPGGQFMQTTGIASQFGTDLSQLFGIPADTLEAVGIPAFDPDFLKINQRLDAEQPSDQGQFGITVRSILPELNDTKLALHLANYHAKTPQFGVFSPPLKDYPLYTVQGVQKLTADLVRQGVDPATAASAAFQTQASRFQLGARYFTQYPEDIGMVGFSLNTSSPRTGTAYYGEVAHHIDAPLAVHTGDQVSEVLPGSSRDNPLPLIDLDTISLEEIATEYANKRVDSILERDVTFSVLGGSQFLGPRLGAVQSAVNFEIGWLHVWDMPSKSDLLLVQPGLVVAEFSPRSAFATADSWGYRVGGVLIYPNVLGGLTLKPSFIFSHDVDGNSPIAAGPFRQDRKSLTLGLNGEYIKRLQINLGYNRFWGAGQYNLINDRDHVSFSIRYTF